MTTEQLTVLGISIAALLSLLGLGFAAMSTNQHFTVPKWVPKIFFILAIVVVSWIGFFFWNISIFGQIFGILGVIALIVYLFLLRIHFKKGRHNKMLIGLGSILIVIGIVIVTLQLDFHEAKQLMNMVELKAYPKT
jgi:drug/metabolite transporter (DMT)-like permease